MNYTNCGNEVKLNEKFKRGLSALVLRAFADTEGGEPAPAVPNNGVPAPEQGTNTKTNINFPTNPTPVEVPAPAINYEELIARARKEEKEKLYPQIDKLKSDLAVMTKNNNTNLLEVARLQKELEKLQSNSNDSEWKEKYEKLFKEFEEFKKTVVSEEQLRAELEKEYEVKSYLAEQKAANKDTILPVFADTITGNTKEEIDSAVQKAIELTNQAREQLGVASGTTPKQGTTSPIPTPPPTPVPSGSIKKEFDLDYIRGLSADSKEYAEWRKSQGLK